MRRCTAFKADVAVGGMLAERCALTSIRRGNNVVKSVWEEWVFEPLKSLL